MNGTGSRTKNFLSALDPKLADLRDRLYEKAHDASVAAGNLGAEWGDEVRP